MPYPASLIAYAFVIKGIEEANYVTQMKLQKIVYFAHGYHLAKYGEPLISENFEAWKYGPVAPSIYSIYKLYGSDVIVDTTYLFNIYDKSSLSVLDKKANDAIDYTWKVTKDLSATSLSAWSHQNEAPWAKVYKPNQQNIEIPDASIKEYFQGLLSKKNGTAA